MPVPQVLRGSEQLKPGDHYVPGERLTIQLGGTGEGARGS